jgi:hypothetical protein
LLLGTLIAGQRHTPELLPGSNRVLQTQLTPSVEVLTLDASGYGSARFWNQGQEVVWNGAPAHFGWCLRPGGDCNCPDGRPAMLGLRPGPAGDSLVVAVTTGVTVPQPLAIAGYERRDLCARDAGSDAAASDAGPPLPGAFDPCLEGSWRLVTTPGQPWRASLDRQGATSVAGAITLTFRRGQATQRFDGLVITLSPDGGIPVTVGFSGGSTATYTTAGGRATFRPGSQDFRVNSRVSIAGQQVEVPIPRDSIPAPGIPSSGGYRCGPTRLEVDNPQGVVCYYRTGR